MPGWLTSRQLERGQVRIILRQALLGALGALASVDDRRPPPGWARPPRGLGYPLTRRLGTTLKAPRMNGWMRR